MKYEKRYINMTSDWEMSIEEYNDAGCAINAD